MSEEPLTARRTRGQSMVELAREDLDLFGVEELDERIAALQAEIARVEAARTKKLNTRAAADALFGGGGS